MANPAIMIHPIDMYNVISTSPRNAQARAGRKIVPNRPLRQKTTSNSLAFLRSLHRQATNDILNLPIIFAKSFNVRQLLILLFVTSVLLAHQTIADPNQLPDIGDAAGGTLSPYEERALGEAFYRSLQQQVEIVDDPELQDYLQQLGKQLTASADPQPYPFTFFLVNDPAINAFAAPGGFIGIHTGLFLAAETESELAGVLAHEVAHVTQHHLARAYEAAGKLSLPTAAAMLGAILLSTQNGAAGQAALLAIQAGSVQYQINFTRANEHEADRVGIHILQRSGLDPSGMPRFFQRLAQKTRYAGGRPPEFLSTHPITTDRIAEAEQRAAQYPATGTKDRKSFQLVKARLRVLTARNNHKTAKTFASLQVANNANIEAMEYGQALALLETGDPVAANKILRKLARKEPDNSYYKIALARAAARGGDLGRARKLFADTLTLYPENRTATLELARVLLQMNRKKEARALVENSIRAQSPPDPGMYFLLAQISEASGNSLERFRAMAEHYYLKGQTHAAAEQLTLALRTPNLSFYDSSRMDARLKVFQRELEERNPARDQE